MSTSGAENFIKQAREVQDGELEKFCLRISGFLQNQDLGSEVVDCLRRLYFIIAATKYRRKLLKLYFNRTASFRESKQLFLQRSNNGNKKVKLLVNKVVPRYVCHYRTLKYCRDEGMDGSSPDHGVENNLFITGNLGLLNMGIDAPMKPSPAAESDLVPYNGTVVNIRNMVEKMEHTENGRLQLENKIHSLECKIVDSQARMTSVELENKNLTSELQALQKRLSELEQQMKSTEKQKYAIQRQLQENNRRLNPLHLELQKIIEKTNNILNPKDPKQQKVVKEKDPCEEKDVDVTEEDAKDPPQCDETA